MSQVPPTPAASTPSAESSEAELARLAQLHRMSRTAGLGSSEYTAVNNTAVVGAVLGVASSLSLFTPIFLFLPVVGVVISLLAIRQITSSNRTQTGMALAVLGLVGSLAFAAFTGLQAYQHYALKQADKAEMRALTDEFGSLLVAKDYKGAYAKTDARFQEQVSFDRFTKLFDEQIPSVYGEVKGLESNGLFEIEKDPENLNIRMAVSRARLKAERLEAGFPTEIRYRRTGEQWLIFALPELFPAQHPPGGAQPQPQGPPGP